MGQDAAGHVIDAIAARACAQGPFEIAFTEGSLVFQVEDGLVNVSSFGSHGKTWTSLAERLRKRCDGSERVPLRELLADTFRALEVPSRNTGLAGIGKALFRCMCITLQLQLEVSCDEAWWREASCLQLTPSHSRSKNKVMSNAYKDAVLSAASSSSEPVSTRQLMGSDYILRAASKGMEAPSVGRQAGRAQQDKALRLLANGRVLFKDPPALHYSVDGVQASGEHNNVAFACLPRQGIMGVPPIQAEPNLNLQLKKWF